MGHGQASASMTVWVVATSFKTRYSFLSHVNRRTTGSFSRISSTSLFLFEGSPANITFGFSVFNSWDRNMYLVEQPGDGGTPTVFPQYDTITRNILVANYPGAQEVRPSPLWLW